MSKKDQFAYEETLSQHYPIAEGRHRRELKENPAYARFIEHAAQDTRTRKRDLITLISRPVTRLPRLALMLEHIQKLTPPEHSDHENLPITLNVLNQLLKSTQPGIVAAEGRYFLTLQLVDISDIWALSQARSSLET